MIKYDGITKETLFLLMDNRFRDSRDFYEENKEKLKKGITIPMRQIAGSVGEMLYPLDPMMNLNPVKMVSRIFRDTRYTKDKRHYRENMWIMFMRDKHQWQGYPCFWFEVEPDNYSMGIGLFGTSSGLMETFRKEIRDNKDEFSDAVWKCQHTGALIYGSEYKKMPEGCPEGMENYYKRKDFGFIYRSTKLEDLETDKIIDIIKDTFTQFSPMYSFLLNVSDKYFSEG